MKPDAPGHNRPPLTYKEAGVDIDAGDALVEHIKPLARSTDRRGVMGGSLPGASPKPGQIATRTGQVVCYWQAKLVVGHFGL